MKWEKLKPPEPDDPMCCCECDIVQNGCCCDWEDLDETFNRWLRDKMPKSGCNSFLLGALIDNLEISLVPALVLLPLLIRVAALHYLLGIIILTALPGLVLWLYYATHTRKRRTLFFLTLALYSLAIMYYLFITEILPRGDVSQGQLCTVTTGMIFSIISLVRTKRGPGFVSSGEDIKGSPHLNVSVLSETSSSFPESRPVGKWSLCPICKITRPPRAGHCRTCGACVYRLDHHCVWINSCVGQGNHRSFLLTLSVFLLTALYGIGLVLRSLCPQQYLVSALFYCPGVYSQTSSAICFTCVWYSVIVTGGLIYLLVSQLVNISFNVTEREAQLALRNKTARSRLCGLAVITGTYSQGFYQNWVGFLTMADMAGKWYLIGFASNGQWFVQHRDSMKMGTAMLNPTPDGDLDISYASVKPDGTCWRMNNLAKKTDVPGKFTYTTSRGNDNELRLLDVDYDQYALTHTIKTEGGNPIVVNKLYGRGMDLSQDLLEKFRQFSLGTGILAENIAFLPQNGECTVA
ncbi:palmitoyltransferase ZDHHC23-A-like isoform X2 [Stigmatopora nigra]